MSPPPPPPPWLVRLATHLPARLRLIPFPALRIIAALALINLLVWIPVTIVLRSHPLLATPAVLSYTFGLRHALDADHISAIDLMTRRLVAAGEAPVTVGTWFSLGHSTIVVLTCVVVAATSGALESRFDGFGRVGGIVGTGVSAAVLILLGVLNAWVLLRLVRTLKRVLRRGDGGVGEELSGEELSGEELSGEFKIEGGGPMVRVFKGLFRLVDRPWKMYPLGVLFGLGFDTSSEIAVLGIASIEGAKGTSFWLILIFPLLFTAGMCLLDTTDGALMMTLYTSTAQARDPIQILYYSIVLSAITVFVALCIGAIQVLSLAASLTTGDFSDKVNVVGDHFDVIGGGICGAFVLFGALSVLVYKPWRKRMDQRWSRTEVVLVGEGGGEKEVLRETAVVADARES